jgi:regulator of sigma E protease
MWVLYVLLTLSVVVVVHEFGHFAVARLCGVPTTIFSVGFGRRLCGIQLWNTDFRLSSLPLGGYVAFTHETGPLSVREQPLYVQVPIYIAGIVMNLLLAIVLLTSAYTFGGSFTVNDGTGIYITDVVPGSSAEAAGIHSEDILNNYTIDGQQYRAVSGQEVIDRIAASHGNEIQVRIRRGVKYYTYRLTPTKSDVHHGNWKVGLILGSSDFNAIPLLEAAPIAVRATWDTYGRVITFLPREVVRMFETQDASRLSGPVGIVGAAAQQPALGAISAIFFIASFSIGLAALNSLPVPGLDGFEVVRVTVEKVMRRRLSVRVEGRLRNGALVLLVLFTVVVMFSDSLKFIRL